jgi:nucleoside-diphosphate-sugar epimerase
VERIEYIELDLSRVVEIQSFPDIVFHIAGEKRNESTMWDVNLEGTRRLLDWSARQGVKRFVYLSSVGVYGAQKDSGIVTERTSRHPNNTYEASKNAAEDWVREYCQKCGIDYVILQPSNVIGWVDGKAYPLLGMMRMIKRGLFTYFDNGEACFNYVAVEDVAAGLAAAMLPQAENSTFILNSPIQMKLAVDWIADELGVAPPSRKLPASLGYMAGELASALSRLTGKSLPFSRERFNELTNTTRYDGGEITARIGFTYPRGVEGAIRKLVRQYVNEGLL